MFSDPSGLAPEGEKNNKTQAPGADIIGSGFTGGYWNEVSVSVYLGSFKSPLGLDNPLAPAKMIKYDMYGSETSYVWIESGGGGSAGGAGMTSTESSGGFSGSRNSSRKTYNNTTSKSMRDQNYVEKHYNNTVYANKGGIDEIEKNFNVTLTFKNAGVHDLYEITSVTPNNYVMNTFFVNRLKDMLNNGIRPVALSTNQTMNNSPSLSKNVNTEYSGYGILTAFIGTTSRLYRTVNGDKRPFNNGQNASHEFFGHTYHSIFGDHYPWYSSWLVKREIPAMEIENYYLFMNGLPQRNQGNEDADGRSIGEWLFLKTYP